MSTLHQLGRIMLSILLFLLPYNDFDGVVWQQYQRRKEQDLAAGWSTTCTSVFGGADRFAWWVKAIWWDLWWYFIGRWLFFLFIGGGAGVNRYNIAYMN